MTGGQIYAAAERSVSRFWNLTRSQVYAELPRLEQAGLIEAAGAPGPRGAQPYQVTQAFRDYAFGTSPSLVDAAGNKGTTNVATILQLDKSVAGILPAGSPASLPAFTCPLPQAVLTKRVERASKL